MSCRRNSSERNELNWKIQQIGVSYFTIWKRNKNRQRYTVITKKIIEMNFLYNFEKHCTNLETKRNGKSFVVSGQVYV